ncbi:MAG TPA: glycosyltransferase family 4 protein [Candidatus Sulfotelmatobacter sp.]|nr:glycosyltransferase family 4 protein [Candidatus Sulfotelmatobacter sp.]
MRIAQVAPLVLRIPPVRYGGTERVIFALTEELVRRGHVVTLFAAGTSQTSARLVPCSPRPLWQLGVSESRQYQQAQLQRVINRYGEFDIIHSHADHFLWLAGDSIQSSRVATLHGSLGAPETRAILKAHPDQPLVSISDSQRRPTTGLPLNWVATVYNGLDLATTYRLGRGAGGYLLFLGRISPEKDPVTAIRVAIRSGLRLKIAARVDPADEMFFEQVRILFDHPLIEWLGEQDDDQKARLLADAAGLLLPIDWDEPFGLAFIEALASGTPVISRPRGSVPELLHHGEHGFLVETEDEMVEACRNLQAIDRRACREWALSRFSAERMARDYERVYRRVIAAADQASTTRAGGSQVSTA